MGTVGAGERHGRHSTKTVPSRSVTRPRPSGTTLVRSRKAAPLPGILAKIPWGPWTIRPVATS